MAFDETDPQADLGTVVALVGGDALHSRFEMKRVNNQEAYSLDSACTNWRSEAAQNGTEEAMTQPADKAGLTGNDKSQGDLTDSGPQKHLRV